MELTDRILDNMVTAVVVLDARLRIQYINAAAEDLLQVSDHHALDQALEDLILIDEVALEALREALGSQQPFTQRDAVVRLPESVSHHVDLTVNIIEINRNVHALLLELQPLNRLQRINRDDESVARQETARRLIRGLAHEVKNPLGGIRGAAQLLERELDAEELREYTGVIIAEADRLKELVDRLLGPQTQLRIAPVPMLQVLEHVVALIEAEQPDRITWVRDYDPSLPDVEADESQLIQAVLNIVRNSLEALKGTEEPVIRLMTRAVRQFTIGSVRHRVVMQVDICDNGPGIEADLLERIFFPMISGRPDGTGLGLAITQNVVTQHKGSIQAQSRPGHTCFSIYLPFTYTHTDEHTHQQTNQHNALQGLLTK